jgi:LPXTG-motif cell wall-anchored protein
MGRRRFVTAAALAALVLSLFATPSVAQTPEQECLVALQAQVQPFTGPQLEALGDYFDDPGDVSLEAFLRGLLDDPSLSLDGLDPVVCTIYITNVFADDGEADDDGGEDDDGGVDDGDDGVAADDGERTPPSRVLGTAQRRTLPITGFDVLWLTVLGAAVLGLGYVAVRRSRDQTP